MRPALLLLPLVGLAACATPREACLADATSAARINAQLIAQTEANIARGFAVERGQRVVERRGICRGVTESGEEVRSRCDKVDVIPVRRPVAIDLEAERAKLASLIKRRSELASRTDAAVAQCQRLYPE